MTGIKDFIATPLSIHTGSSLYAPNCPDSNTFGSSTWPSNNRAIYIPISIPFSFLVNRAFLVNGTAASGNFDIGIYTTGGVKLYSTGSTAQSGTSVVQYVTVGTPFILPPGSYYFALAISTTSATVARITSTSDYLRTMGLLQQASALPLPATMSPASLSSSFYPFLGIARSTSGFTG